VHAARIASFFFFIVVSMSTLALVACRAKDTPRSPEEICRESCAARATRCTDGECEIGCNMSLDRLVEHEGDRVIDCVKNAKETTCSDALWARCAVDLGPHADGGPPAPPPAPGE
jgi:hypothetical protein